MAGQRTMIGGGPASKGGWAGARRAAVGTGRDDPRERVTGQAPDDGRRRSSEDCETAGVGCAACVETKCGSLLAGNGVAGATVAVCSGP